MNMDAVRNMRALNQSFSLDTKYSALLIWTKTGVPKVLGAIQISLMVIRNVMVLIIDTLNRGGKRGASRFPNMHP
jgi:hypothetical protein